MLLHALLLIHAAQQAPGTPQRSVPDPGIIATGQRVTPAGVQSVFNGRVGGVRFGARPGELWVAVPGSVYRIAWQKNRVLARSSFSGRPGVGGVALDPVTGNALVTSVGRLPAPVSESPMPGSGPVASAPFVAHLTAYSADGIIARRGGDGGSAATAFDSPALGDFMAGSPAVARKPGAGGRRLAVVPLPANDAVAILDAGTGELLRTVALGVLPVAAVLSEDGATAWVTTFGGEKPKSGQRSATQCCDLRAEPIRIDARGKAERGSVARIDVQGGRVTLEIATGLHPTGLAWDEVHQRLYVANGNSDSVTVIDTRQNRVASSIAIAPFRERRVGLAPTAVALAPGARTLFVALGGANAVAVYDVSALQTGSGSARLRGLLPTGWYPSTLDVSADGKYLAVGTLLGVGSGTGATEGSPGKRGRYVHAVRGSVNVIPVPRDAQLGAYSTSVAQNNRLHLQSEPASQSLAPRANVAAVPVPDRPGDPSPIQHVVYIIRENRTFDQVLGDIGKGASDSSLVIYGRDVTPNAHALAEQFVLLDHFFASGGNSADGHQWLTQANETDYPMWPLYYGRSYPSEGNDPLTYSSGGFLWEAARARGHKVTIFGEYAPAPSDSIAGVREKLLAQYRDSQPHDAAFFRRLMAGMYNTRSEIPSLDSLLVREYPGWTQETPDVVKADVILEHLKSWEAQDTMPALVMVILPSDHTVGTTPGWCTPRACVADNDLALGRVVDGLTHSSFWKSMAILVVEDDAQNGVDHIDGHRTVALVASPYARRGVIDSTFYSQLSMLKTIELMLGLPALSMFDLVANDMRASFIGERESPDYTPYSVLTPQQSIYETNRAVGEIHGAYAAQQRNAARASMRMRFDVPDAAPSDRLNRILWHDARGWGTPFPGVRRSVFLPLAVDIDDDDREEKEVREVKRRP